MTHLKFYKYQGTGNDFVMIDNRQFTFNQNDLESVRKICDRKFGIGADGLILIQDHPDHDFEMVYFNADGSQSLCGNGSRCAVKFANFLGIIDQQTTFLAIDGAHEAFLEDDLVHLKMGDVEEVTIKNKEVFINTGSPHHIKFVDDVEQFDVVQEGKRIRYMEDYSKTGGTNVNFVQALSHNQVFVRTYERGVEDETLSCGTGVTAVSLAVSLKNYQSPVHIKTLGGDLQVSFNKINDQKFEEIYLIGPAGMVFEGSIEI
ncbi:diaminopimelate epimerase [Fulvivirgaceae bacterium BMA10]|uniref:Diaminopimelate epimerase n=1 Tax=Splendidivirga corallicola TaxID=3051826 RepID=A0ABT8KP72_9BACT|nr:diaminopimelate epimerase [Fulvivirgaceae bacterium BMA10]